MQGNDQINGIGSFIIKDILFVVCYLFCCCFLFFFLTTTFYYLSLQLKFCSHWQVVNYPETECNIKLQLLPTQYGQQFQILHNEYY